MINNRPSLHCEQVDSEEQQICLHVDFLQLVRLYILLLDSFFALVSVDWQLFNQSIKSKAFAAFC